MASKVGLILEAAEYLQTEGSSQETASPDGLDECEDCSESEENGPDELGHEGDSSHDDAEHQGTPKRRRFNSSSEDVSPKRAKLMDKHNKNERRRRKNLKHSVHALRDQLTVKTRRPVVISVLKAAYNEIQSLKELEKQQDEVLEKLKQRNIILNYFVEKSLKDIKSGQATSDSPLKQSPAHGQPHSSPHAGSMAAQDTTVLPPPSPPAHSGAFSWYKTPYLAAALQSGSPSNGLMPHSPPNGTASSSTGAMPALPYSPFLQHPAALSPAAILSPSFSFYPPPSLPTMPLSTMPSLLYPYYASQPSATNILPHCPFVIPRLSPFANSLSYCMRKNGYSHQEPTIPKSKCETNIDVVNCNADTMDDCNRAIDPRRIPPPALIPIQHRDTPNHLPVIMSSSTKRIQSCSSYSSNKTYTSSRQRKLSHP